MGQRAFGRRTHRLLGVFAAVALIAGAGLFSLHAYVVSVVRDRAVSSLSSRLGRAVTVGKVKVGFSSVAISDVEIEGLGRLDRVVATFKVRSFTGGEVDLQRADVYGLELDLTREPSGATSVDDILARFRASSDKSSADAASGSGIDLDGVPIVLHDVSVRAVDAATNTEISFAAAHVTPDRAARSLGLIGASVSGSSLDPRIAALLVGKDASEVSGSIAAAEGRRLVVDLSGSFTGSPSERWSARGSVAIAEREATMHIETEAVSLGRLINAPMSRGLLVEPDAALLDANVEVSLSAKTAVASGAVTLTRLSFAHRLVATLPVRDVTVSGRGAIELDRLERSVRLRDAVIESGGVAVALALSGQLADAVRAEHPEARLSATLSVGSVECQALLDSIPAGLIPDLQGFELVGKLAAAVELDIDWANLEKTRFESDILADGTGIDNCRVTGAPERVSADRLRGSFDHTVPVNGSSMTYTVGPENADYVPLAKVSRHLTRSLMTTEDSRFYRHRGFITKEFRGALIKNLERGRFAYGASSISMQVVKNVMLAREKTISRKLEELFLTWYIERELGKDRILEIYVNAIEFGPGIYGIKPAAERYFGKEPSQLNPVESAFFSSILPAPVRRFKQYCRGWAGSWTKGKIDRILDLMLERNRLDPDAYLKAIDTSLIFRGNRREICRDYEDGLAAAAKKKLDAKGVSL